jgi:hypothetical protein
MSSLSDLRDLVEGDLDDSSNDVWTTGEIDRAIERALREYSLVRPQQAVGTISLSVDGREIGISTLTGLIRVVRVWHPYTSSDPEDPPEWRMWELWGTTLYILDGDEPADGEVVRVYYHKQHTIDGLNGESTTTIPAEDEGVVVFGAAAYAALQKARGAVGEAGVSTETPEHWLNWAAGRLKEFRAQLRDIKRREVQKIDKRVPIQDAGWQRDELRDGI